MNEIEGKQPTNDDKGPDDPVVDPVHVFGSREEEQEHKAHEPEETREESHQPKVDTQFQRLYDQAKDGWGKTSWDRRAEIFIATLVAVFAGTQLGITYTNNNSTTKQINSLIQAATQIQSAAWQFSGAAYGVNNAVWNAVGRLNDQATQLGYNVTQSKRLADETGTANQNTLEADRPWMGGFIQVTDFDSGKKPSYTIAFTDSGKRPARVDISRSRESWYMSFPSDPDSEYKKYLVAHPEAGESSTDIVVPGQPLLMTVQDDSVIDETFWRTATTPNSPITFFIFAKVEYTDPRTNKHYWTHICQRFYPRFKTDKDPGFRNCKEYNEAK